MVRPAFHVATDLSNSNHPERALDRFLLSSNLSQGLLLTIGCIRYLLVSSPHAVRCTTFSENTEVLQINAEKINV